MNNNETVYLVQYLEGEDDNTHGMIYYGVFSDWEQAVAAANQYGDCKGHTFTKPQKSKHLYAEYNQCIGKHYWRSVRIVPFKVNERTNMS